MSSMKNEYLAQVMEEQRELENNLKARRAGGARNQAPAMQAQALFPQDAKGDEGTSRIDLSRVETPSAPPVEVRITGWWRWKNVIVPPNAYVVHTRRGHDEPLHCGLGVSFRFDPVTDSFLVVPSAMQTILINARCICRERQGILVQGYVQWIIEDFRTAYRKLDFTDAIEPMRLVNIQLREQAEAAIKDKVATMSVDDVLSDKQPIIKELTARLKHVAEGDGADRGLGLRIVTVQIKEAVVSSPTVWETLQRPFRAERAKEARLAELTQKEIVQAREAAAEKAAAELRIATQRGIEKHQADAEAERFDREQAERGRRARIEAEALEATMQHEREKIEKEAELARLRVEAELTEEGLRFEAQDRRTSKEIEFEAARRRLANDISDAALRHRLVEMLPAVAEKLPKPAELKSFQLGGNDGLAALIGGLMRLVESVKETRKTA